MYLSPTFVRIRPMPELLQRDLQPDVAHDGRDDGVAAQPAFGLHLPRAHQHHVIAVEHAALSVDENRAVAVAVKSDTQSVTTLFDDRREFFWMRRSHASIDVLSVGLCSEHGHIEAKLFEQRGCDRRHRAIGAVDGEPHAVELFQIWQDRTGVLQILAEMIGVRHLERVADGQLPGGVSHERLDAVLELTAVLHACTREHFDAVVLVRIVRRRNHHASVEIERSCQIGHGGRWGQRRCSGRLRPPVARRAPARARSRRPIPGCRGL